MRNLVCLTLAVLVVCASLGGEVRQQVQQPSVPIRAQNGEPVAHPRLYQQTWYDYLVRQFNPKGVDWGRWLDERRQAFLESPVANPFFKYSLVVTCLLLVTSVALAKVWIDKRRVVWLTQEQFDDLRRHDGYSRETAHVAIERYNRHMEKCNRVVEAELATRPGQPWPAPAEDARAKSDETLLRLADKERERAALEAELQRKNALVTELTMRLNKTQRGGNGHTAVDTPSAAPDYKMSELVKQVSELQQQLHHEREQNKRLKGMQRRCWWGLPVSAACGVGGSGVIRTIPNGSAGPRTLTPPGCWQTAALSATARLWGTCDSMAAVGSIRITRSGSSAPSLSVTTLACGMGRTKCSSSGV